MKSKYLKDLKELEQKLFEQQSENEELKRLLARHKTESEIFTSEHLQKEQNNEQLQE